MNAEEIKKAYMSNDQLSREELEHIFLEISEIKRYLEAVLMVPGAAQEAKTDPEGFRKKYGITGDYSKDAECLLDPEISAKYKTMNEKEYLEAVSEPVFRYFQYIGNKIGYRDAMRDTVCVPENKLMRAWRNRQMERSKAVAGQSYKDNVHIPFVMEMADGCSVGCKFCAVGAKKLQSVLRYNEENAEYFRNVVKAAEEVIGKSVYASTLYYSSEPLDLPEYEQFAEELYRMGGLYPQVTTAIALRKPERTRQLLKILEDKPGTFHRFSVLSLKDLFEIFDKFTPRELARVELLGQYPESPNFVGFVNAGRARENKEKTDDMIANSICCVAGFIVNLPARTIRLVAPIEASERFPTGEVILEKAVFETPDEMKSIMLRMIDKYMAQGVPKDTPLKLYDYFTLCQENGKTILKARGYSCEMNSIAGRPAKEVVQLLAEGTHSLREMSDILAEKNGIDPVDTYWVVTYLWGRGVIDEFYRFGC